jgi:hypothetical protein
MAFGGVVPVKIADNAVMHLGLAVRFSADSKPAGGGLLVGFSFRF